VAQSLVVQSPSNDFAEERVQNPALSR